MPATNLISKPATDPSEPLWDPAADREPRRLGVAVALAGIVMLPFLAWGGYLVHADRAEKSGLRTAYYELAHAHDRLAAAAPRETLPVAAAVHGRDIFTATCAACHKADGTGVKGLGKDLTVSPFVAARDDAAMQQFLLYGRPTARPSPMPPKGGNPELTEKDLQDVIVYVRGLQDPRRMPSLPAPAAPVYAPVTEADKAAALAAAGGDSELAEYIAHGSKIFLGTCSACHGKDGKGMPGNGKSLLISEFFRKSSDDALLAFVKKGRDPSDPANTTGVGMPARGGNPALSDDDLLDVIAYVRSLQAAASKQ